MISQKNARVLKIIGSAMVILFVAVNQITKYRATAALREYSARFSQEGTPNATEISMQRVYFGVEKKAHGVLLIHGIPSSTSTFSGLCDCLQEKRIPFIAPMLTGFGNTELNLLPNVSYEDWLRDALNGYDTLAQCAEKITIVSTSTGSLIATWISGQRKVENLVMIVPNFAPGPSAKHYKAVLDTPVASQAFRWLMPYKFADPEDYADRTRYRYPFHEVNSVRQMFLLQEKVTPEQIRVRRGVFLMTGSKDTTVSTEALVQKLEKKRTEEGIEYRAFEYDAGHSLLQDAAKQVQKQILEILAEHPTEE